MQWLMVFLGGGIGACLRFLTSKLFPASLNFPFGTLTSNAISCLLLGFISGIALSHFQENTNLKLFLMVGLCGGFSTFSTFSLDTINLIQNDSFGIGIGYIALSLILCLISIYLGIYFAKLL